MSLWNSFKILFVETFTNHDGERVDRLGMERNGYEVQVLRFNGDNSDVLVKAGRSVEQMPLEDAGQYIKSRTDDE